MYSMLCATPMACSVALTSAWKLLTSVLCTCRRQVLRAHTRPSRIACRGRLGACPATLQCNHGYVTLPSAQELLTCVGAPSTRRYATCQSALACTARKSATEMQQGQ